MSVETKYILAIDTETSGLDENKHSILSSAFVLFGKNFEIVSKLHTKILPQQGRVFNEQALVVNGYTEEKWKDAAPINIAMSASKHWLENLSYHEFAVVAHNAQFDQRFLSYASRATGIWLPIPKIWTCTKETFKEWRYTHKSMGSNTLDALANIIEYKRNPQHDALEDAIICGLGYKWLLENWTKKCTVG